MHGQTPTLAQALPKRTRVPPLPLFLLCFPKERLAAFQRAQDERFNSLQLKQETMLASVQQKQEEVVRSLQQGQEEKLERLQRKQDERLLEHLAAFEEMLVRSRRSRFRPPSLVALVLLWLFIFYHVLLC